MVKSQWSNLNPNGIQITESQTKMAAKLLMPLDACQFYGYACVLLSLLSLLLCRLMKVPLLFSFLFFFYFIDMDGRRWWHICDKNGSHIKTNNKMNLQNEREKVCARERKEATKKWGNFKRTNLNCFSNIVSLRSICHHFIIILVGLTWLSRTLQKHDEMDSCYSFCCYCCHSYDMVFFSVRFRAQHTWFHGIT